MSRSLSCPRCAAHNIIYYEANNVCWSCGCKMYETATPPSPQTSQGSTSEPTETTKAKIDSAFLKFLWGIGVLIAVVFFFAVGGGYLLVLCGIVAVPILILYGLFHISGRAILAFFTDSGSKDEQRENS